MQLSIIVLTILQLDLPSETKPRQAHSAMAINMASGIIEVTLFGGCSERSQYKSDEMQSKLSETTVWTFCTQSFAHLFEESASTHSVSSWLLVNVAINDDLGTDERIRDKIVRMKRLISEAGSGEYNSQQLPYGRQGLKERQHQMTLALFIKSDKLLKKEFYKNPEQERKQRGNYRLLQ